MQIKNGALATDELVAYDAAGAAVTGLVNGDWTKALYNPSGSEVSGSVTVTVTELGNGGYRATFTPNALGQWLLILTNAANDLAFSANYEALTGVVADIYADTDAIDSRLPSDPADESLQQASHTTTQGAIAALNDLDQAGVQTALTAQGYTAARAVFLDYLDAAITSRSSHSAADVDTQLSGTHGAGSWESGAAVGDWSAAEREQIRDALGVGGTKTTAASGQLQALIARVG